MKFSLLILLLISLVGTSTAQNGNIQFQRFFGKFAAMQLYSKCFGNEYMSEWIRNLTEAVQTCNQEEAEDYLRDLPLDEYPPIAPNFDQYDESNINIGNIGDINEENLLKFLPTPMSPYGQDMYSQGMPNPYPIGLPGPYPQGMLDNAYPTSAGIYSLSNVMSALQGNLTSPVLLVPLPYPIFQGLVPQEPTRQELFQQGLFRQKRQVPMINAENINKVYQKIRNKAGNFTCVVKTLNYFDDDLNVNADYQIAQITELDIDGELKSDVFDNMVDCFQLASGRPLDRKSLMPPAVQRAMSYMQCLNKMDLASCVKNELVQSQDKFDIEALNDIPAGSTMDLGDKMLAILWGKFSRRQ